MKTLYQNPKFLKVLLTLLLILLYLPLLTLGSIPTNNGIIPISLCYVFSVVFLPFLFLELPRLRLPPWYICCLYVFVLLWAIVQAPAHGVSKSILHWLFGAYLLLILSNIGKYLSKEDISSVLQVGVLAFFVAHLVYNIIHWDAIYQVVFQGRIASTLTSLTRGGRNLDATWLALGCFLIVNPKIRISCLLYAFAYAIIGVSRSGLIACLLCLVWVLVYDPKFGFRKKTAPFWLGIAIAGIGAAFAIGLGQRLVARLTSGVGEGAVSFLSGREALWQNVGSMFTAHPFGVGVGNAVPVLRAEFGFASYEDVMHNVFFQLLLDEGFIGALWFLALVAAFLFSQRDRHTGWFRQPLAAYLLGYLLLSLVQFHGGEALMIFVLGCYLFQQDKVVEVRWPWRKRVEPTQEDAA